jgi:hypothetical protein
MPVSHCATCLSPRTLAAEAMRVSRQAEAAASTMGFRGRRVPNAEIRRRFKILGTIAMPRLGMAVVAVGRQVYPPRKYEQISAGAHTCTWRYADSLDQVDADWPIGGAANVANSGHHTVDE